MSQYTPGPWRLRIGKCINDNTMLEVFGQRADHVVTLHKHGTVAEQERAEADARLIAAAPDLLEALDMLLGCVTPREYPEVVQQARAAIRKAKS